MSTRLNLGYLVITRNAADRLDRSDVDAALGCHCRGNWGDVCRDDWKANDWSLENGERILSSWKDSHGIKFWIITERDRSATTVLLPEDY